MTKVVVDSNRGGRKDSKGRKEVGEGRVVNDVACLPLATFQLSICTSMMTLS